MRAAWLAALLLAAQPVAASAHGHYTGLRNSAGQLCCSGWDCAVVLPENVRGSADTGFEVREAASGRWLAVPEENILVDVFPEDGRLHACILGGVVRCLILPSLM